MVLASAYFPTLSSIQASDSRACTNRGAAWAIRSIALIDRAVAGRRIRAGIPPRPPR